VEVSNGTLRAGSAAQTSSCESFGLSSATDEKRQTKPQRNMNSVDVLLDGPQLPGEARVRSEGGEGRIGCLLMCTGGKLNVRSWL
jgi:hypothetical protein